MIEELEKANKIDEACKRYKKVQNTSHRKYMKLDEWLNKESIIFENETKQKTRKKFPKFKRGEVIKVDFGINIGSELSHTHYAIVLNSDDTNNNDNITVMPITSKNGYKRISLGKLLQKAMPETEKYNLKCYGCLTQIKTISKQRVFATKSKYICDDKLLNLIDLNIKSFLTKEIDISKTK